MAFFVNNSHQLRHDTFAVDLLTRVYVGICSAPIGLAQLSADDEQVQRIPDPVEQVNLQLDPAVVPHAALVMRVQLLDDDALLPALDRLVQFVLDV